MMSTCRSAIECVYSTFLALAVVDVLDGLSAGSPARPEVDFPAHLRHREATGHLVGDCGLRLRRSHFGTMPTWVLVASGILGFLLFAVECVLWERARRRGEGPPGAEWSIWDHVRNMFR
jgi:hypothetical protein